MRDLLFPSSPALTGSLRAGARAEAQAFVQQARAMVAMVQTAAPEQREFVAGEIACVLHLAPATATGKVATALALLAQPRLVAALEHGRLGTGHALAVLAEVEHLDAAHAAAVLDALLGENDEPLDLTPGELRAAVKRAAIVVDPEAARRRHEAAGKTAGVRGRPGADGMGQLVIDCTATQTTTALAAVKGRAAAMSFDDPDLTQGQKEVAAFLHALGCDRTGVQAVIECPVERAVDLHALSGAAVWTVDVRMPAAVALGLSDHPAVLTGYGPIGADQARALLPAADLVRACVDARTGEVLTVDAPVRRATWTGRRTTDDDDGRAPATSDADGTVHRSQALRQTLIQLATSGSALPDLTCDGYVPTDALGRLVDLRDITSTFPGDSTPSRRTDRDHRLPWPLGRTDEQNLQNAGRRWHRAKHNGWHTRLLTDGTIRWTSPTGGSHDRRPRRTPPPPITPGTTLPPLDPDPPR